MVKRLFFGIAVLAFAGAVFAQAYKWVDKDGVVHYSDRPEPGAEQFELPQSKRRGYSGRRGSRTTYGLSSGPAANTNEKFTSYESLDVAMPGAEETLWNIEGVLTVRLDLQPALQPGHQLRVYLDGEPRQVGSLSFQLDDVYRGAHNLQAEVLDNSGQLLIRSSTNRFFVQQNSIQN